jgi:ceramide glucosyltransferase
MTWLAGFAALLACVGVGQALAGWWAVRRFRAAPPPPMPLGALGQLPGITVLKPLHGDEALLEAALASLCMQDYPQFQVVFGVHGPADPALAVVRRLQARFAGCDIAVVVDATRHGRNGKVSNLINMLPSARHDVLVIADSDVHAAPDYLRQVVAALAQPGTGLVTTLYTGLAAEPNLAGWLGASGITHGFLPGALLARDMGRQDCLGATMALRRETLAAIGGLPALADHLADDAVLGRKVGALGLAVRLASTVPATTVAETGLGDLLRHELRWARTIRALVPWAFLLSGVQYKLAWAALAMLLSGFAPWSVAIFLAVWAASAAVARGIDAELVTGTVAAGARPTAAPLGLLPLRDVLSLVVLLAAFMGREVRWRGQVMRAERAAGT